MEDSAGYLVGIEIKSGATLKAKDIRGLETLASITGKRWTRGIILYTGSDIIPFAHNLHALSISQLWSSKYALTIKKPALKKSRQ